MWHQAQKKSIVRVIYVNLRVVLTSGQQNFLFLWIIRIILFLYMVSI